MTCDDSGKYQKKILTIPNLLSLVRLCMIPVIVWLYNGKEDPLWALIVLLLSGATDIIDGIIARRFNMVSDFGKAFDPIADKLTQIAMLFCLVSNFPYMIVPLVILIVKEITDICVTVCIGAFSASVLNIVNEITYIGVASVGRDIFTLTVQHIVNVLT